MSIDCCSQTPALMKKSSPSMDSGHPVPESRACNPTICLSFCFYMIDLMARRSSHHKLNSDVSTWLGLGSSSKFYPPSPSMWYEPEKMIVGTNSDLSQIRPGVCGGFCFRSKFCCHCWHHLWGSRTDGFFSKLARKNGLILMWDYTCKHTLAASNVLGCSKEAGSAAIAAEEIKRKKYSELAKENHYIPIAQETLVIVRSDEFNDRGKVGIKARSPQTSPWTKKIHLMFIKITLPNIGRRPRVIACELILSRGQQSLRSGCALPRGYLYNFGLSQGGASPKCVP